VRLGPFELSAIETGSFRLDGGAMFGVVPKVLWSKTNPADDDNRISMAMRALLVDGNGHRLIVDSGAGTKLDGKMLRNYVIESVGLERALELKGIDPGSVTDAVATHLHFDHAGGFTYYDTDGDLKLVLPEAVHHIQRKQWEAALDPNDKDRASFFEENYLPIEKEGKLDLVDGDAEILPGVRVVETEGHTPGHQVVLLETGEGNLLYCGDLIPLASHINLPYIMSYDHFPLSTLEEKKRILGMAADEGWVLFFEHDPLITACRVRRTENGRFQIGEEIDIG
jgi:glyoxylase-like metal-dependent hydrolase (beta-lactamase superfamily II)